jgi:hypothetical protein
VCRLALSDLCLRHFKLVTRPLIIGARYEWDSTVVSDAPEIFYRLQSSTFADIVPPIIAGGEHFSAYCLPSLNTAVDTDVDTSPPLISSQRRSNAVTPVLRKVFQSKHLIRRQLFLSLLSPLDINTDSHRITMSVNTLSQIESKFGNSMALMDRDQAVSVPLWSRNTKDLTYVSCHPHYGVYHAEEEQSRSCKN